MTSRDDRSVSGLPGGWPRDHFTEGRLADIVERAFFMPLRQSGFDARGVLLQDALAAVWRQYDYIRCHEESNGGFVRNPGGLMWRLLRGAADALRDEKPQRPPPEFDEVAGFVRNADG